MTSVATYAPRSGSQDRAVGLDVLRGVAVGLVLLNHASPAFAGAGIVGVTIFFVLSGYLITGVLERGFRRDGTRSLRRFYLHRALRLFPPLLFMLAVFAVVEGLLNVNGRSDDVPGAVAVALTYTSNLPPFDIRFDSLFHLWTLAVEEQFYLVWPLVLAWVVRRWGVRRSLALACAGTYGAVVVSLLVVGPEVYQVYTLPTSWTLALLTGALVHWAGRHLDGALDAHRAWTRAATAVAVLALAALCMATALVPRASTYLVVVPLVAACAGLLVLRMRRWPPRRDIPTRALAALGTISYAAYLWNLPIVHWAGEPQHLPANLLPVVATLAAATASWWLVERPARALRARLDARAKAARGRQLRVAGQPLQPSSPAHSPGLPVPDRATGT